MPTRAQESTTCQLVSTFPSRLMKKPLPYADGRMLSGIGGMCVSGGMVGIAAAWVGAASTGGDGCTAGAEFFGTSVDFEFARCAMESLRARYVGSLIS